MRAPRLLLLVLLLLNGVVLLGQIWPEGAPPFARTVNILFLVMSFAFFSWMLLEKKTPEDTPPE